jgi:SEC-C motif-containing protein
MTTPKVGRNDPCPCGSGRKYKACCAGKESRHLSRHDPGVTLWEGPTLAPAPPSAKLGFGADIRALLQDKPHLIEAMDQVERHAAAFVQNYCVASDLPGRSMLAGFKGTLLPALATYLASLQMTYGRRLATTYVDAVDAIARRRLHLASLALRAYIELSGALVYYERRIAACLMRGIGTQPQLDEVVSLFDAAINGGRFPWEAYYLGGEAAEKLKEQYAAARSTDKEPAAVLRQKSVAAFVAEADAALASLVPRHRGAVKMIYALLSDTCHPSVGGDSWFAEVPQVEGRVRHRATPHDEMMRDFVRRIALPILVDVNRIALQSLNQISAHGDGLAEQRATGTLVRLQSSATPPPLKEGSA